MGRSWFESGRDSVLQFGCARTSGPFHQPRFELARNGQFGCLPDRQIGAGVPAELALFIAEANRTLGFGEPTLQRRDRPRPDGCSSPVGESALHVVAPHPVEAERDASRFSSIRVAGSDYIWIARLQAAPGITQAACSAAVRCRRRVAYN